MIVDPDFLDHWRTRMVVDALGDELAPMYIMRLWAHCQQRKADRFEIPSAGLKGLCHASGDAEKLEKALGEAGYIERDGAYLVVTKWAEKNAALIAAWENGNKGGRKPNQNPRVSDGLPKDNPAETQGEPKPNPDGTDRSRGDKTSPSLRSGEPRASRLPKPFELPDEWREFCQTERPDLSPDRTASKFSDYWHGKPGKAGTKLDWLATWRNWVREERSARALPASEPAWRTEQRQRTQQAAPGVAVQNPTEFFIEVEARDVTAPRLD